MLDIFENTLDLIAGRWGPARWGPALDTGKTTGEPMTIMLLPAALAICQYCRHIRVASTILGGRCARCRAESEIGLGPVNDEPGDE